MWTTDTPWLDVAVVMSIFAIGNILFGQFEEHRPKGRRLLKVAVVLPALVGVSAAFGRPWAFGLIGLMLAGALYIHAWWLPRRGVSGWTAEPRARYYALIGHQPKDA